MKSSIQTKLLVMCIFLVLLTTVGLSVTYYVLATQYMRRESRQRIRIAFDIILDDFADRLHTYADRVDEFLRSNEPLQVTTFSYQQDPDRISSISFISTNLAKAAEELKRFAHVNAARRLLLYGTDKRLLTFYQQNDGRENLGIYVTAAEGSDTYIPLDDPSELTPMLLGRKPIPDIPVPSGVSTYYEEDIPLRISTDVFTEGTQLGIRVTAPIYHQEILIGVLIADVCYTQSMMERYASLSKTEINLFVEDRLSVGTLPAYTHFAPEVDEQLPFCEDILKGDEEIEMFSATLDRQYYQGQCAFRNNRGAAIGAITASLSQDIEKTEIKKILNAVVIISILTLGIAFGLSVLFSRKTIYAIQDIVRVIGTASEGDLRPATIRVTHDEVGVLALKLNQMIYQLRNISEQVQGSVYGVNSTADTILQQVETLIRHMEQQSSSVENTTDAVEKINRFIDVVVRNTSDLLVAAAQNLSSIQETRASIDGVTTSTTALTNNLHLISSSVEQVNQSVKHISDHTGQLVEAAQHTENEMCHIDRSLRDVSQHADRAQQLAKETMDAAVSGQTSVDASLQGMIELKDVVSQTAQIIHKINSWGEQVSSILDIVDDITEQTSLLALNASIISAQAGERGRGFSVVADEIKELAMRTKASTQEIGTLIHELQASTEDGVNKTAEGIGKAEQGVHLANAVKNSLATVLDSATRASTTATDTAQVIQHTAASSQAIRTSMNRVTERVSHIRTALQGEEQDIEQVVRAVENISEMAENVNQASSQQTKTAKEIEKSMQEVTEKFSNISDQTEELRQNSFQIVNAMHTIESTTEGILRDVTDISGETVKNLLHEAEALQQIVSVFKVS